MVYVGPNFPVLTFLSHDLVTVHGRKEKGEAAPFDTALESLSLSVSPWLINSNSLASYCHPLILHVENGCVEDTRPGNVI